MNDDNLTQFRSEMTMPDDETTQRTYERATSGRRRLATRPRLVAAVAVIAAAGIAGGITATLGGGGSKGAQNQPKLPGPGEFMRLNPLTADFTASGGEYTSIAVTLRAVTPATTLHLTVVRSDATQLSEADGAGNTVVFDEQVSPTLLDSAGQDATQSEWSGTLTPSDWTGGCQQAFYRIDWAFGEDGGSSTSGWFQCSGPDVDAANPFLFGPAPGGDIPVGVTGDSGPTGWSGPTGATNPSGLG
jgi:hypothetical protein